ncbi:MAG TPA: hypothetical protein VM324_09630 [Egibacteraceae bacterium]|jgi:hypothetical protein|nr:hypothetical protein [Egibacteraceae bacterium]
MNPYASRTPLRPVTRRTITLAAAAVVCAVVVAGLPAAPVWAEPTVAEPDQADLPAAQAPAGDADAAVLPGTHPYGRTKRTFPKQGGTRAELGTRGYFPDYQCLTSSDPCLSRAGNFRPEATAQARVIRALGSKAHTPVAPLPNHLIELDRVQWEVAPLPHDVYAPDHDNPTDWEKDCGDTWRVDVAVDDGGDSTGIVEVRRWSPSVHDAVRDRLICYIGKADAVGFRFIPHAELNVVLWARSYRDNVGASWCVWAPDPLQNAAGHVYFAPRFETPPDVRQRPGCRDDDDDKDPQPVPPPILARDPREAADLSERTCGVDGGRYQDVTASECWCPYPK